MKQLFATLLRLAQVQGQALDRLGLQAAVEALEEPDGKPQAVVAQVLHTLQLPKAQWLAGGSVDPSEAPGLLVDAQGKVVDKYYGAQEWDSPEALKAIAKTLRLQL